MISARLLKESRFAVWDAAFVALAVFHGLLLLVRPSIPLIAIGLWWNANTISHNFIHRPFFRSPVLNRIFSGYLSLLLGFPQSFWRARHLKHHGWTVSSRSSFIASDAVAVLSLWTSLLVYEPLNLLEVYLPGFVLGLGLCYLQGYYEHEGGAVSHYGWLYNVLLFNDGYHVEHHAAPWLHWRAVGQQKISDAGSSRWPAILRWLEVFNLCTLERLVLNNSFLQRFVLNNHEQAFRKVFRSSSPRTIGIIGGGLFPRTAIVLRRVLPDARVTLIDMSSENMDTAARFLTGDFETLIQRFDASERTDFDLIIIPLAFVGNREAIYRRPPASQVLVHDWIWRKRGESAIVSWLLLKRVNLIK